MKLDLGKSTQERRLFKWVKDDFKLQIVTKFR